MERFENSPLIMNVKSAMRDFFISLAERIVSLASDFYEWLKAVPLPVPPPMLKLFGNNKANLILFTAAAGYMLFINIRTYILFAADKRHAVKRRERIPESRLMRSIWLGGAVGAELAMLFKKHKTHHKNFTVTVTALMFVQLLLFSFVLGFLGFWTFL